MRYSILGFNQEKLLDYNISMNELLLLQYIYDVQASTKMEHILDDDGYTYTWVCHAKICEDLPILNISETQLKRYIKHLIDIKLIVSKRVSDNSLRGTKAYYGITESCENLRYFSHDQVSKMTLKNDQVSKMTPVQVSKMTLENARPSIKNDTSYSILNNNSKLLNNISISKDIDMDIVENVKKSSNNDIKDSCIKYFIDMYHNICVSLPRVRTITDKRKKAIMKIVHKYSNEDIEECLRLAESSGFLTGKNDRGWKADIDFILREDKFVSILEGKYKTKYKRNNAITDMDVRSNTMSKDDLKEFKEAIKNGELQRF